MEVYKNLPIELINKVFMFLSSDTSKILKPIISDYFIYVKDSDNIISFYDYVKDNGNIISFCDYYKERPEYLVNQFNIKLHKKINKNIVVCHICSYNIKINDYYYKSYTLIKNKNCINCTNCQYFVYKNMKSYTL